MTGLERARTAVRRLALGLTVLALGLGATAPARAADVIVTSGLAEVTSQTTVISWVDGQQRMLLDLEVSGVTNGDSSGMVLLATPTTPTVGIGDPAVIDALATVAGPDSVVEEKWWPELDSFGSRPAVDTSRPSPAQMRQDTLTAHGTPTIEALTGWLEGMGTTVTAAMQRSLQEYVERGWVFTSVDLDVSDGVEGRLPPLEVVFPSSELVVPMALLADARPELVVRSYVIDDERIDRTDSMASNAQVMFAGPVPAETALTDWLAPFGDAAYVTTTQQVFTTPSRIDEDMTFRVSALGDAAPVSEVVEVRRVILGLPAGLALVAIGMVVVAVAGVAASRAMQRGDRY